MLPSGPRSTYPLPSTVRPDDRAVARQILASINAANAKASEVRTGLMTTGCDGDPVVNSLDGTTCNNGGGGGSGGSGGGTVVLFNPATRKVFGTLGKIATAGPGTMVTAPAPCTVVMARLRRKRRFTDNLGNVYGPDGEWLSGGNAPAVLETDYVHTLVIGWRTPSGV